MPLSKTLSQTGTGGTIPWLVDQWANLQSIGAGVAVTGTATWALQGSYDDFSPQWDLSANTPTWFTIPNLSGSSGTNGTITNGPYTMIRLLISAGTGSVVAKLLQSYAGHTV